MGAVRGQNVQCCNLQTAASSVVASELAQHVPVEASGCSRVAAGRSEAAPLEAAASSAAAWGLQAAVSQRPEATRPQDVTSQ